MDPYIHTALALGCIYIAYKIGRSIRHKEDIENFVSHLEEQGYVYIEQMKDGSFEFVKHWKVKTDDRT